jgi:EH domain-containing protein 3/EH domain-containing protein 1
MSLNFKKKSGKERQTSTNNSSSQTFEDDEYAKVIEGIKRIYKQKIKPVEVTYNFEGTYQKENIINTHSHFIFCN